MRDYLVIIIVLASLPVGLIQPYYGVLVYAWISYMYPHQLAWSFAVNFPVAKLAALSTTLGLFFRRNGSMEPLRQREILAMLALFAVFTWSSYMALEPAAAWDKWQEMVKIGGMSLVTASLLTDHKKLRIFLYVVAFSLGFYGIKGGIFSLMTGGQFMIWGPGISVIAGNNNIGLALNMTLPLFWYLAREQKKKWLKFLLYGCFALTIPSVMFTYSRASAICLGIVLLAIFLQGRMKIFAIALSIVVAIFAINYAPERWWDRQLSTMDYEEDGSAMSRLDNWAFCWRVAIDRPLTGAGFGYTSATTFRKYAPGFLEKYRRRFDSHSIYLGILAAHGFIGLFAFMLMIMLCMLSCRKIKRDLADNAELKWATYYANMIQISLLALLVNGAFVNMEYFDLVYHLVALVACLKVLVAQAQARETSRIDAEAAPVLVPVA